jgi:hypothetical protein
MQSWLMMFKKDFRMSRLSLIGFCGLIVLSALLVSIGYTYAHGTEIAIGVLSLLLGPMMLYFPVHMLLSLRHEWHRSAPLWLHTPFSGYLLLLSKMAVGLIYWIASLLVVGVFGYWIANISIGKPGDSFQHESVANPQALFYDIRLAFLFAFLAMIATGLYMGVWASLISTSMQAVRNRWRKLSILIGIIIFLIPTWGFAALYHLEFIRNLLHVGGFQLSIQLQEFSETTGFGQTIPVTFYAGEIVFYILVVSAVFYITSWLLDKKVEV